ncbi:MAG: hypothetical protein ACI84R_000968 [Candidatus Azotimanducaceae bacterium]|jgi:hypothetical protein
MKPTSSFFKKSAFFAVMTSTLLVGCIETTTPVVQKVDAEAIIQEAAAIYKSRGFNQTAIANLVVYNELFFALPEARQKLLRAELDKGDAANTMLYTRFEPDTGRSVAGGIANLDLITYAKTATSCFAKGQPWRDCDLNYHPIDGCFLEGAVLKECKRVSKMRTNGQRLDNPQGDGVKCWNYEKGPTVSLPYQAQTKSQLKLVKTASAPAATANKTVRAAVTRVNTLNRPVCTSAYSTGPSQEDYQAIFEFRQSFPQ